MEEGLEPVNRVLDVGWDGILLVAGVDNGDSTVEVELGRVMRWGGK